MKNLMIFICVFFNLQLSAQEVELDLAYKTNLSELIVEGRIINSYSYKGADGFIYTKNEIRPSKLFKGIIADNTPLFIITRGGRHEGMIEEWSHVLQLSAGNYGVFFLRSRRSETENLFSCIGEKQGFYPLAKYNSQKESYTSLVDSSYDIDNQLYNPLEQLANQSVKILPEYAQEENCLELIIHPQTHDFATSNYQLLIDAKMTDSPKYLTSSKLRVYYDITEFGNQIVNDERILLSHGSYLPTSMYSLNISDVGPGVLEIEISSTSIEKTLLDIIQKNVLQVTLLPLEFDDYPFMLVDENFTKTNTILEDEFGTYRPECFRVQTNFISQVDCPVITNVTNGLAAGVGDMSLSGIAGNIVIKGENFGTPPTNEVKPAYSDVQFESVDGVSVGDSTITFLAPEIDYISWTNTQIELRVPSINKEGENINCAATGKVWVITESGDDCTVCQDSATVYVRFGAFNNTWSQTIQSQMECNSTNTFEKKIYGGKRRNLVDVNENNGYNLIIGDMFPDSPSDNTKVREQIIKALDVWRCNFGINVTVVDDVPPYSTNPATCRVERSDSLFYNTSVTYMRTSSVSGDCPTDNDIPILSFGILVNAKALDGIQTAANGKIYKLNIEEEVTQEVITGAYDPTASTVYRDLQSIMIHEFGHAFQLRHTKNSEDIMARGDIQTDKLQRTLSSNDVKAGEHIGDLSLLGTCEHDPMEEYVCTTNSTESTKSNQAYIHTYPNPAQRTLNIETNLLFTPCQIRLFDVNGKELRSQKVDSSSGRAQLKVASITSGIYLIEISNLENGYRAIQKVIIN